MTLTQIKQNSYVQGLTQEHGAGQSEMHEEGQYDLFEFQEKNHK